MEVDILVLIGSLSIDLFQRFTKRRNFPSFMELDSMTLTSLDLSFGINSSKFTIQKINATDKSLL